MRYPETASMANTFSALKRMRQTRRRTEINRVRKTRLRHHVRAMRRALDKKDANTARSLVSDTFSVIDKSAKWGIIKANTAARYKSRISHRIRALSEPAPALP